MTRKGPLCATSPRQIYWLPAHVALHCSQRKPSGDQRSGMIVFISSNPWPMQLPLHREEIRLLTDVTAFWNRLRRVVRAAEARLKYINPSNKNRTA